MPTALIENSTLSSENESDPEITALVFIFIFIAQGVLGNILVIVSVATDKKLRTYIDGVVINVAVLDLMVTGIVLPSTIPYLLNPQFRYNSAVCDFLGLLTTTTCIGSLMSLTFVAVNKYVFICHTNTYNRIFNKTSVGCMIACTWLYGLAVALPLVCGYGGIWFSTAVATCVPDVARELGYMFILSAFGLLCPMSITFFSYARIFWKLYQSRKKVGGGSKDSSSQKKYMQVYTMFAVSALFTCSWCPYCVASYMVNFTDTPQMFTRIATWMGFFNSCLNCIVLGAVNKNYKAAYTRLLCACKLSKSKRVGVTSVSSGQSKS